MNKDTQSSSSRKGTLRTVAVVTKDPQPDVLDTLLDAGDYDVVFVESLDSAYSSIKRVTPHLVIVCLDIDDADSFQLLSMLRFDSETAGIPVCTYVMPPAVTEADSSRVDIDRYAPSQPIVASMN
jgi:CheY-like chemotaxis protein